MAKGYIASCNNQFGHLVINAIFQIIIRRNTWQKTGMISSKIPRHKSRDFCDALNLFYGLIIFRNKKAEVL